MMCVALRAKLASVCETMNLPDVTVVDYGVGNLLSVRRGLERCGASVAVTADPDKIYSARKVVLPGVGAFSNGMAELQRTGLDTIVQSLAARGVPLLGICLGMQLLLDESEEFGKTAGLGLVPGRVVPVPALSTGGLPQKVPHIGWSPLALSLKRQSWESSLLQGIKAGEAVYFVHSFMADPSEHKDRLAECFYGGVPVLAALERGNVMGCQFHPEKSGEVGLKILSRFLTI